MADYKESPINGTKWNRASRIIITNEFEKTPSVMFVEQEIISLPNGKNIVRDIGNLHGEFIPDLAFDLYDPLTGDLSTGTSTMQDAYKLIYSYFRHIAAKRDASEGAK